MSFVITWFLGLGGNVKAALSAIAASVLVFSLMGTYDTWIDDPRVRADERAEMRAEIAESTAEQLRERGVINERVKELSDCELIRELGGVCDVGGE